MQVKKTKHADNQRKDTRESLFSISSILTTETRVCDGVNLQLDLGRMKGNVQIQKISRPTTPKPREAARGPGQYCRGFVGVGPRENPTKG